MSLQVIKAGILDTIQDAGRYGYQHLGINPGGAMDHFARQVANILVGNDSHEAIIEMHFPAAAFLFEEDMIIAISGADFTPTINGEAIPLLRPVIVSKNSVLQLAKLKSGTRCYLAVKGGFNISNWLNSYSTNLKASAGGYAGRALQKGDTIAFKKPVAYRQHHSKNDFIILPWQADITDENSSDNRVAIIKGNEWEELTEDSKEKFITQPCTITLASDRMGYRLEAGPLSTNNQMALISSAVGFGTVQLLPNGQLIVLMADHQTTGGYPRVAHVITTHHSKLAQMKPGEKIYFYPVDQQTAEELLMKQQQHLLQLQNACNFRLQEYLYAGHY